MASLINKQNCRRFMLEYASRSRAHKFSRVSKEALEKVELKLREIMRNIVDSHPSKGKTIR